MHASLQRNDIGSGDAGEMGQAAALGTNVGSVPGSQDQHHDVLWVVMAWVETGAAPGHIVAREC